MILALACDRSLRLLHTPATLLSPGRSLTLVRQTLGFLCWRLIQTLISSVSPVDGVEMGPLRQLLSCGPNSTPSMDRRASKRFHAFMLCFQIKAKNRIFVSSWIGQTVCARRLPPLFPHHMWNVLDRSAAGSARTTNSLKAFHHTFNSLLSCQHPTIWKLLESLEAQQNISRSTIFKIGRGDTFKPSAKERRRNERIANLIAGYTRATADSFLTGIAYNYMM